MVIELSTLPVPHIFTSSYRNLFPNSVHVKFCKYLIGIGKYSSNIAALAELGRYPLGINAIGQSLKYWLNLHHTNDKNISNNVDSHLVYTSFNYSNDNYSLFSDHIKHFLQHISFSHVWENKASFNATSLVQAVKKKLVNCYEVYFFDKISEPSSKLRNYSLFKTDYVMENYILLDVDKMYINQLARLRVSNHCLEMEKGRHTNKAKTVKVPPDRRFCKLCNCDLVEDEFHFICECNTYDTRRNALFADLSSFLPDFSDMTSRDKYYLMMNTNDMEILTLLAFFVYDCFVIRKSFSG